MACVKIERERPTLEFGLGGFVMGNRRLSLVCLSGLLFLSAPAAMVCGGEDKGKGAEPKLQAKVVKIGAVAYSPSAVTIFEGVCRYLNRNGLTADYVLYSNYDSLVDALQKRQIDIAWNTPLAHAQYHLKAGGKSQTLVMRDVDCNVRVVLIARADANIRSLADLKDKTLVLGSRQAAEATVLPRHFLEKEGQNLSQVKIHSLDGKVDFRGNPCSSEVHVLRALGEGVGQAGIIGEPPLEPRFEEPARAGQRSEASLGIAPVQPLRFYSRCRFRQVAREPVHQAHARDGFERSGDGRGDAVGRDQEVGSRQSGRVPGIAESPR